MSTPIVGAAILSALIVGYKAIPVGTDDLLLGAPTAKLETKFLAGHTKLVELLNHVDAINVRVLLEQATRASRRYIYKGLHGIIDRPI